MCLSVYMHVQGTTHVKAISPGGSIPHNSRNVIAFFNTSKRLVEDVVSFNMSQLVPWIPGLDSRNLT